MNRISAILALLLITLICASALLAQPKPKPDTAVVDSVPLKVLEERMHQTTLRTQEHLKALEKELELRSTHLENKMETYLLIFLGIFALLGFMGYKTVKDWIKQAIESRVETIFEKRKEDFVKQGAELAKGLIEDVVSETRKRLKVFEKTAQTRLDTAANKLEKLTQDLQPGKKVGEDAKQSLAEYENALEEMKTESEYSFDDWYYKGVSEYNKKNYEASIRSFSNALTKNPDSVDSLIYRGVSYDYLKKYQEAITDYSLAIEQNPTNEIAYSNRGIAYDKLRKFVSAQKDFAKAIELKPTAPTYYSIRGASLHNQMKFDEALADHNKAIQLDPNDATGYLNRGNMHTLQKNYETAIHDYNKAIEIDPNYVVAYSNRGTCYYGLKRYEEALADCNKAIELDKDYYSARLGKAELLIIIGKFGEALETLLSKEILDDDIYYQAIKLYLTSIILKVTNKDTEETDTAFDKVLRKEFEVAWVFDELESWLKVADITASAKKYIEEKTELLKSKKRK